MKKANRVAWGLAGLLAVVVLGGIGLLGLWLRCYWVAMYRGQGANLRGAFLMFALLRRAELGGADLRRADLCGADLRDANIGSTNLMGVRLYGADLRGASFDYADLAAVESDARLLAWCRPARPGPAWRRPAGRGLARDEYQLRHPGSCLSTQRGPPGRNHLAHSPPRGRSV